MGEDLRHVHPESLLAFLRARLEEEFAEASEASLTSLARQYSTHPDYHEDWPEAVPGEPCQRLAKTLDDQIRPVMLIGLDELGEERANDWADWTVKAVMAARDEELQRLRADNEELRKRAELAEAAIVRVREDHGESVYMPGYCFCANPYPCPTVRALDGEDTDRG